MSLLVTIIFTVIGGLGIFIYGMNIMSKNVQDLAGNKLRNIIKKITGNRFSALTAGVVITAILQSSSVTTVMVVGFIEASLMNLSQALGVILGSNIGSTFTGWLLVLKLGRYGLPLTGVGALLSIFTKKPKLRKKALLLMGFGMIFFGLELMKNGIAPLKEMPGFILLFQKFDAGSYSGIILSAITGAFITAIVQSSAVTVGITMTLASQGLIDSNTAVALVLGQNIGTTITAFLASLGTGATAKKAAYSHILIKVTGVMVVIPLFHQYVSLVKLIASTDDVITFIAFAHTIFNVLNSFILLPFTDIIVKLWDKVIKEEEPMENTSGFEKQLIETPFIVLEKTNLQIEKMADEFQTALDEFLYMIENDKTLQEEKRDKTVASIVQTEKRFDRINVKIRSQLTSLLRYSSSNEVLLEVQHLLEISDLYESFGDYGAGLVKLYLKAKTNNIKVAKKKKIAELHKSVSLNYNLLTQVYKTGDVSLLQEAQERCREINKMLEEDIHIEDKPVSTSIYSDILAKYRRLNRHILYTFELIKKYREQKE